MDWPTLLPAVIGICGLGGIIFTALRYRRDDTTAVLGQQDTILNEIKSLNEELRLMAEAFKGERDACRVEAKQLQDDLRAARDELSGQVTQLHKKLEDDGERTSDSS